MIRPADAAPPAGADAAVEAAAQRLAAGGLVAFPTETVYGLGARADSDAAVAAVYAAKGRPADHPLIVHVAGTAATRAFAASMPPVAGRLIERFWPGPLTVIVPRARGMAAAAAGGQDTIGLRRPAHPLAQRLLARAAALGVPGVAAPSANRFGRISPTEARHVEDEFPGGDVLVLDGGPCEIGIESAIVDCSRGRPVLLRPGALLRADIERAAGERLADRDAEAPRASGTLEAHYAPRAALRLVDSAGLPAAVAALAGTPGGVGVYSRTPPLPAASSGPSSIRRRMPDDAALAAHELFAVLRELDAAGVGVICVEAPPAGAAWDGVRDRLQRAAASAARTFP